MLTSVSDPRQLQIPFNYKGQDSLALLALHELLVDGKDAVWLARVRQNGLFGCSRCRLSSKQWGECVMSSARRAYLERTILEEKLSTQRARAMLQQPRSISRTEHELMMEGLVDSIDNPLFQVFGCVQPQDSIHDDQITRAPLILCFSPLRTE